MGFRSLRSLQLTTNSNTDTVKCFCQEWPLAGRDIMEFHSPPFLSLNSFLPPCRDPSGCERRSPGLSHTMNNKKVLCAFVILYLWPLLLHKGIKNNWSLVIWNIVSRQTWFCTVVWWENTWMPIMRFYVTIDFSLHTPVLTLI